MTKEALKDIIEMEFERSETISQFKSAVLKWIDVYDNDVKTNIKAYVNDLMNGATEIDLI